MWFFFLYKSQVKMSCIQWSNEPNSPTPRKSASACTLRSFEFVPFRYRFRSPNIFVCTLFIGVYKFNKHFPCANVQIVRLCHFYFCGKTVSESALDIDQWKNTIVITLIRVFGGTKDYTKSSKINTSTNNRKCSKWYTCSYRAGLRVN
jgi:hypothetical protein